MRLLRTSIGGFINTAKIVRLADDREQADTWVAVLGPLAKGSRLRNASRQHGVHSA
jgi:hypothetical protein